jgi:hypothetical protein
MRDAGTDSHHEYLGPAVTTSVTDGNLLDVFIVD